MPPRRWWSLLAVVALVSTGCADQWAQLGHDGSHTSVSAETSIAASTAANLAVTFEGNLGHDAYSSPVAVWTTSGRRLVIAGNNAGTITALDAATQQQAWAYQTAASVMSTATVVNGVVYIGSNDGYLYALDLATGALDCRYNVGGQIQTSPAVANPDGTGLVVYAGDIGHSGGDDGGHFWAVNAVDPNAAPDCSLKWSYSAFGDPPGSQTLVGSWSPPAFSTDANGRGLVVFGSSSPEGAVYALDAVTGQRVWRFQTAPAPDGDVGGGITISPPGANGFADGVAYFVGKDWLAYALDLTTGAQIWQFNVKTDSPNLPGALRNTPALDGNRLYFGYPAGVYALNATTGAKIWKTAALGTTTAEVFSSPALSGPVNDRVLVVGDQAGKVWAFDAQTGAKVWSYATRGSILASAAFSGGRVYITATDGILYGFGTVAATGTPVTTITSPTDQQNVPNPNGTLTFTGTATDDTSIATTYVGVYDVTNKRWWNGSTHGWSLQAVDNQATLASPGAASTGWSFPFPIPFSGGTYEIHARSVDGTGAPEPVPVINEFFTESLGAPASATISAPNALQTIIIPNQTDTSFNVTVSGSATDSGGPNPGVAAAWLTVNNVEHAEYFCGSPGCNGYGWSYNSFPSPYQATLDSPNAVTTNWSSTVQVYGHAHTYIVTAWAVDRDGNVQQFRPQVTFCTNFSVQACPLVF